MPTWSYARPLFHHQRDATSPGELGACSHLLGMALAQTLLENHKKESFQEQLRSQANKRLSALKPQYGRVPLVVEKRAGVAPGGHVMRRS